jgi:hypothetical protein
MPYYSFSSNHSFFDNYSLLTHCLIAPYIRFNTQEKNFAQNYPKIILINLRDPNGRLLIHLKYIIDLRLFIA